MADEGSSHMSHFRLGVGTFSIFTSVFLVCTNAQVHTQTQGQAAPRLARTVEAPLGVLAAGAPRYWHSYEYPIRAAAEAARGSRGTVADVFDRHWLYTIADGEWQPLAGKKIARIGPLDVATNTAYTARYMEALFPPRGPEPYGDGSGHRHPGSEAWYVLSGAQCLETSNGLIVASAGDGAGRMAHGHFQCRCRDSSGARAHFSSQRRTVLDGGRRSSKSRRAPFRLEAARALRQVASVAQVRRDLGRTRCKP